MPLRLQQLLLKLHLLCLLPPLPPAHLQVCSCCKRITSCKASTPPDSSKHQWIGHTDCERITAATPTAAMPTAHVGTAASAFGSNGTLSSPISHSNDSPENPKLPSPVTPRAPTPINPSPPSPISPTGSLPIGTLFPNKSNPAPLTTPMALGPSPNLLVAPGSDGSELPTAISAVISFPLNSLGTPPWCCPLPLLVKSPPTVPPPIPLPLCS